MSQIMFYAAAVLLFFQGCAGNLSLVTVPASLGYVTSVHKDLISLPPPKRKIVVAVYKFRDQTGQYKYHPTATTFSTAVTQGATSMLIKALEDSGWFIPVEREGLAKLLTERKIINATWENNKTEAESHGPREELPPLLYASIAMEGGIIAYNTNIVTGGFGAKYYGVGGSAGMRRDQVNIYLRSIGIKNGAVLKSVSTSKTILSREVDFGIYRFIRYKRLLEAESGLSTNEPPDMCVLEAVEKAVLSLIIEGIRDNVWALKNPEDANSPIIQQYLKESEGIEREAAFDRNGNLVTLKDAGQPAKDSMPQTRGQKAGYEPDGNL
ncbi:MAG: CsgG/HfaB family protein [Pseudomonadota bacterium]